MAIPKHQINQRIYQITDAITDYPTEFPKVDVTTVITSMLTDLRHYCMANRIELKPLLEASLARFHSER